MNSLRARLHNHRGDIPTVAAEPLPRGSVAATQKSLESDHFNSVDKATGIARTADRRGPCIPTRNDNSGVLRFECVPGIQYQNLIY